MTDTLEKVRLDRWLWAVRLFKTRNQATEAVKGGKVHVNGERVKPSRVVQIGDRVEAQLASIKRTVVVKALLEKRVGAKLVASFVDDQTPPELFVQKKTIAQSILQRDRGSGRPTKKERRDIEKLLGD